MIHDKSSNIMRLTRWDNQDAMNILWYTYDGNQVTKVTDEGYGPVDYDCKRYIDHANTAVEMGYDDNGNLIYDLDRQIVAIRYNILNLPDTVQFANGNQIINYYDALGTRYKTSYRTRKVVATIPLGNTLPNTNNPSDYTLLTHAMDKNLKYFGYNNESLLLEYVFNSEGYYSPLTNDYFYYVKDHLGNVRETYVYPWSNYKECVLRTQYYPSGLPWNETFNACDHPYRYNGKEFVEMHGLDTYDYGFRGYYPALGRFTSVDPLAEKEYDITPYSYAKNRWINHIDFMGLSIGRYRFDGFSYTEIDDWGIVTKHIDNGDDRVVHVDANGNKKEIGYEAEDEDYIVGQRAWFYIDKVSRYKRMYYSVSHWIFITETTPWEDCVRKFMRAHNSYEIEKKMSEWAHPHMVTFLLFNPVFSLINDMIILTRGQNLYGLPADTNEDKVLAWFDILASAVVPAYKGIGLINQAKKIENIQQAVNLKSSTEDMIEYYQEKK